MPNWKFPCIKCAKPVKSNQKGIECGICFKWVHFKCTNLTKDEYDSLETNANMPFYCLNCKPGIPFTDVIAENSNFPPTSLRLMLILLQNLLHSHSFQRMEKPSILKFKT